MTFEIPSALTEISSAVKSSLDSMVSISGDACDLFGTMGSAFDDAAKAIARAAEHAVQQAMKVIGNISKRSEEHTSELQSH